MKNWCGIKGEEESAKEAEKFEGLIVENAKRLQDMGKTGLIILPGVKDILESVSVLRQCAQRYADRAGYIGLLQSRKPLTSPSSTLLPSRAGRSSRVRATSTLLPRFRPLPSRPTTTSSRPTTSRTASPTPSPT